MPDTNQLTILVPMPGRAHRIIPLIRSIEETTPGCQTLFIVHGEDLSVVFELKDLSLDFIVTEQRPMGDYAHKINQGFLATDSKWVFSGADDLKFHPGWFEAAMKMAEENPNAGVIGTNDLGNPDVLRGTHSTHSLILRSYGNLGLVDDRSQVLNEAYWHEFCDNEFIETAMRRKAYAHSHESIVEHLHPNFGKAQHDVSYRMAGVRTDYSAPLFFSRRHLWT